MKFTALELKGAYLIDLEKREDSRGFFARYFCKDEFRRQGLETDWVQINNSMSVQPGTLRGLHFQRPPHAEVKLVRCIQGSIWDVILDIRKSSPTYGKWFGAELSSENRTMMYVPRGFAHGFISLSETSEILYLVSAPYNQKSEGTIRWNDPMHRIIWPIKPKELSKKDTCASDWEDKDALELTI